MCKAKRRTIGATVRSEEEWGRGKVRDRRSTRQREEARTQRNKEEGRIRLRKRLRELTGREAAGVTRLKEGECAALPERGRSML